MLSIRPKWCISIHPPRAGRDKSGAIVSDWESGFQSTRPVRGGTRFSKNKTGCEIISIHPPRAGRDNNCTLNMSLRPISIHPPRAGRDQRNSAYLADLVISIHPPRAGRDDYPDAFIWTKEVFQSTRPVRGGTIIAGQQRSGFSFQSTRPVRGGTNECPRVANILGISIHPPRAGRDSC